MSHRFLASMGALAVMIVASVSVAGQTTAEKAKAAAAKKAAASKPWTQPKTAWGDPDLQGIYTFSTFTPMERPATLAGKQTFTEAELGEEEDTDAINRTAEDRPLREGDTGTYNTFWTSTEKGRRTGRTSLIVDPPDGRKPPLTPAAQKIRDASVAAAAARRVKIGVMDVTLYDTWADLPAYTQCLARPMPRIGQAYNHGIQILQAPGYVVIDYESMHDTRIIPLDGRPHLDKSVRQWDGDARGHWEGNTLVVDWTNFTDKQEWEGSPQGRMHFVERLTRVDANTVNEEITVDDPTTWTKPWTYVLPWRADDPNYQNAEDLYEYACHEGDYRQMEDALAGSRSIEKANPDATKRGSK